MVDVLLGQGYYLRFDRKLWDAQQPFAPLGALYAASFLRAHGYAVALFDSMLAQSEIEWARSLSRHEPRFAVVYEDSFNYLSKMCLQRMRDATLKMITMARERSCTVIVAGSDATDHPEIYLAQGATAVIVDEGEITLRDLLHSLSGRSAEPLDKVRGICYLGNNGQPVSTPAREFIRDLDTLPFPAWDLVDVALYRDLWRARHGYYSMNMVTTRGCPYHCSWCAKPIYGQRYAVRSPENVADEIAWLCTAHAPDHIFFVDDVFGLKPGWVERFADVVCSRGIATPFKCLSRADLLGDSVVSALRRAQCRTVWIGAESGSQRVLDSMEKGMRVDDIKAATARLHASGIEVGFFLQFGYPGETREDIEMTLQLVRDCRPDDIGISVSYPLPGTRFYERVRQQLGAKRNWVDSDDLAMMYHGPFTTEFYRCLHRAVHKEFRARKLWDRLREKDLGCQTAAPSRIHQTAALLHYLATLPLEKMRLALLATRSQGEVGPVPPSLDRDAAAVPTEQSPP